MRAVFRKAFCAAASVAAVAMSTVCATNAQADVPQYLELPVSQVFNTNSTSASGVFTYHLQGDGNEPMPAGSASGEYTFTIDGTSDITLPRIVFPTVGIYEYQLSGVASDATDYVYDTQVFDIEVYVTNDTATPTVLVYLSDGTSAGDKAPVITFTETYRGPVEPPSPTPTPPPVGASAQTGGVVAPSEWAWLTAACVLAVAGAGVSVIATRRRKVEEADGDASAANTHSRHPARSEA